MYIIDNVDNSNCHGTLPSSLEISSARKKLIEWDMEKFGPLSISCSIESNVEICSRCSN